MTSAAYGHTLGATIAMVTVRKAGEVVTAQWLNSGSWSVVVAGTAVDATLSLSPLYDPASDRASGRNT